MVKNAGGGGVLAKHCMGLFLTVKFNVDFIMFSYSFTSIYALVSHSVICNHSPHTNEEEGRRDSWAKVLGNYFSNALVVQRN